MTSTRPNPIVRLLPSLGDVAFLIPIVFLFTRMEGMKSLLGDGDTGWHIRAGDWMRSHGQVPRTDIFSYTMPDQPWYAWEWLWDIGASWLHQHWGLAGVALASLFVLCLTFAVLYRLVYRRCGNPLISIGLTVLAISGSTIHWLARPHLFTLLLTVIFLMILDRYRDGKRWMLWLLPPLTILWTNLHGGFIVGLIVLGAYGAGEIVRAVLAQDASERKDALKASMPYFATAVGCLAASLVNPYFYQLHVHIWEYLRDPYAMEHIVEFQSANFHHGIAMFLELMLVLGVGAAIWSGLHKRYGEAILVLGWAHLALVAARNIPIFELLAAPVVAVALVKILDLVRKAPLAAWVRRSVETFQEIAGEMHPLERISRVHAVSAAGLLLVGLAVQSPAAGPTFQAEYDSKSYPAAALDLLRPADRVFADDEWGDYLIYRLFPTGTRVFVDGRSDFYGEKFCRQYLDLMNVKYDWNQTLAKYGVDTIVLRVTDSLATTAKQSPQWQVEFDDGSTIVFRRRGGTPAPRVQISASDGGKARSAAGVGQY